MELNYNKNYYHNVYKQKIKNLTEECRVCNCVYSKWNINKHKKSKKHLNNSLTVEEKELVLTLELQETIRRYNEKIQNLYSSTIN